MVYWWKKNFSKKSNFFSWEFSLRNNNNNNHNQTMKTRHKQNIFFFFKKSRGRQKHLNSIVVKICFSISSKKNTWKPDIIFFSIPTSWQDFGELYRKSHVISHGTVRNLTYCIPQVPMQFFQDLEKKTAYLFLYVHILFHLTYLQNHLIIWITPYK